MVFSLRFWPSFLKTNCLFKKKKKHHNIFKKKKREREGIIAEPVVCLVLKPPCQALQHCLWLAPRRIVITDGMFEDIDDRWEGKKRKFFFQLVRRIPRSRRNQIKNKKTPQHLTRAPMTLVSGARKERENQLVELSEEARRREREARRKESGMRGFFSRSRSRFFPLHKLQLSQSLQRNLGGSRLFSSLDF